MVNIRSKASHNREIESFFLASMLVSPTECCRNTDNDTLARKLLGEVDLVTWGAFDQVNVGDGVSLLDERGRGAVERRHTGARDTSSETTSGEHFSIALLEMRDGQNKKGKRRKKRKRGE